MICATTVMVLADKGLVILASGSDREPTGMPKPARISLGLYFSLFHVLTCQNTEKIVCHGLEVECR